MLVDDLVDREVRRVDQLGVLGGLHPRGVALVAGAQVGGERVGAELGPLGEAAAGAHLRSRPGGRPSPAASGTTTVPMSRPSITTSPSCRELALALAHDLAHLGMPGDDRDEPVDLGAADRSGDVGAGDEAPALRRRSRPGSRRRARRAASPLSSGTPSRFASQVSARYIAPVSR